MEGPEKELCALPCNKVSETSTAKFPHGLNSRQSIANRMSMSGKLLVFFLSDRSDVAHSEYRVSATENCRPIALRSSLTADRFIAI